MKTGRLWPIALAGVLGITVAANIFLLWAANDEQALAFEPDYYRKALAWDSTAALAARSAALGWLAAGVLEATAGRTGRLRVVLTDGQGAPIRGATVTVTATPIAHASQIASLALTEQAGAYLAEFPLAYQGLYEFRIEAVLEANRFVATLRGRPGSSPLQP